MSAAGRLIIFVEASAFSAACYPWKPCGDSYLITWHILFPKGGCLNGWIPWPFTFTLPKQDQQRVPSFKGLSRDTYLLLTVPSKSQPLEGQHMQSTKQLSLRRNVEMDLPRTQLSLLVGYGNPNSTAVPRTLAGGRRDKSLISSSTRGNCPLGTTFTKTSQPILLFFVGFLGVGTQRVDSTTYENLICYICALHCATAQLLIHIFSPQ